MRNDSSDAAASEPEDERSVTAVADAPAVTRERAPEVQPGDLLAGRYQIEAIIGKGGSGVVLRAFDRVSATVVAVKVLKPGLTHDPRWEKRFQRELRLGRPVRHPNVCRIFDIGDADGYRFLTMEYATSGTLRDLVKKEQPLRPLPERLADATNVIAGLAAIHEAGIVHRDVKPDNMLRMKDGRLVLSDFGLATDLPDSTMVSVFVGTPHYMAPEVRDGDPATTRSDVWSLGVVLHEIFFGKRPERRTSRTASGLSKSSTSSSTIERAMMALCLRCLADDPADRPENASAVAKLFDTSRRAPGTILWARARRRAVYWAAGVFGIGALAAIGTYRWRSRASLPPASPGLQRLVSTGQPADWTSGASTIAAIPGVVDCLSILDRRTIRIVSGNPRRADDIDLESGRRRPSSLIPETYASGCPQTSPTGGGLLFTGRTSAGGSEIRLSGKQDGSESTSITPGAKPVWLRNGQEFLYDVDGSHAAVFSLPTMGFVLLSDTGLEGRQMIVAKAASAEVDALALLLVDQRAQSVLTIYEGRTFDRRGTYMISPSYSLAFDGPNNLLVPDNRSATNSSLTVLNWRTAATRYAGRLSGFEITDAKALGRDLIILAVRRSKDVWLHTDQGATRLTTDGQNFGAAISPTGDLLVSKRSEDGAFQLWLQKKDGKGRRVTSGPDDVTPDFSRDGRFWTYVAYREKNIVLCEAATEKCRALQGDEMLPAWPRFSPDGSAIAYVTQLRTPRLSIVSLRDGQVREVGPAHPHCPPVWSSPTTVWGFEGGPDRYRWIERDTRSGTATGGQIDIGTAGLAEDDCWPRSPRPGSPFFRRVQIETAEESEIRRLDSATTGTNGSWKD